MLGSNQRWLSRRFYSPSLQNESNTADQHEPGSSSDPGLPPSAMRPWIPGSGGLRVTDGPRTGTDGAGGNGYADRPSGFLLLTWCSTILDHCRRQVGADG